MTSRRSWMLSLALGAFISITQTATAQAQVPRNISYQGQLLENNQAATGNYTITINYYTAGGISAIYTETFTNVFVQSGIFNVILGSGGGFPASMTFNEQYFIGVQVNGGAELQPRTAFVSAPYALNADRVNGFSASDIPTAGQLLVLDANGDVPLSALPFQQGVNLIAGNNVAIARDSAANTFTISSTGTGGSGITNIIAGQGLSGGGSTGDVTLRIAPNGITSDLIAPGTITGTKLDPNLAGEGLYQDVLGNLNVGVDGSSIRFNNDRLTIGTIGSGSIDSSIQRRVTGQAAPGSFITGVNPNGTVNSGTVQTDSSLTRSLSGNDVFLRLNPTYSNTFTAPQNFGTVNANTVNTQDLNVTRNLTVGNGISNGNVIFNTGTGTIGFSNSRLRNVANPVDSTDAVNLRSMNSALATAVANQTFGGDIIGPASNSQINPSNTGIGNRLVQSVNSGSTTINNSAISDSLTINGGTINNTPIGQTGPSTGRFTNLTADQLTVNGSTFLGNGGNDSVTFNTGAGVISLMDSRLRNVGNAVDSADAVNLRTLNNSIAANNASQTLGGDINGANGNNTINTANPGIGNRLVQGVNSGTTTVNDQAINDSLTINGGTINNTPIGQTGPSTGSFTTLMSSEQTMLATQSGDVVIGTATPLNTGAILEIERAQATDLLARLYNTGTGGAELRVIGANGATTSVAFTDSDEFVSSINSNENIGLTLNVRNTGDANSEAGLDGAVALTIERDRDVVIAEDLTVNGAAFFGNGDDSLTFNSGTGAVSFSGSRLQNVGNPVDSMDAVNLQTLAANNAAMTLGGDISGPNGANTLNTENPGIGDRLVTGINSGTTTVNDPAIADNLTIDGGTINNTPIGETGASTGRFTTLSSTGQTDLATTTDRVVIGTTAPTAPNNTILEIERPMADDLMARIYNSGAGGAELRLAGADGVQSTLSFTDASEWVSSINSNDAVGMTFNMLDVGDANSDEALETATVMTIERDGDVLINEDLTVLGAANFGNGDDSLTFNSGTGAVSFSGSRLQNVADPIDSTDAVNLRSLSNAMSMQMFGGDVTGSGDSLQIDPMNAGLGNRLVSGINNGSTTINDGAVNDSLTINGGTINNTPVGATGASTGNFTTLMSSEQTMLATQSGDVVIGTATPLNTGAILEIERAEAGRLLTRLYNTGAGGAEHRIIGANGATSSVSFTDSDEFVSAINSSDAIGLTLNVRDAGDANSQAGLDGAVAVTIERDRDVVINEDLAVGGTLTVTGATMLNGATTFGDGNDNLTFNSGTGTVDFSGSRLTNVGDPVDPMDAVNLQSLNSAVAAATPAALAGDVTGANGSNTIDPNNAGVGDRLITGVNNGTTTINDPAINDDLTVVGGTVDNTPIGATTASSGNFTTLNSTGQTNLATATDRVVIGTASPTAPNQTILEIERPMAGDLMARLYNSGAGGAEFRIAGADGVQSTLSFTDASEFVSSINSNDAVGMTFNVRDIGETNDEATLNTSTAVTIERDRDVLINEDLAVGGASTNVAALEVTENVTSGTEGVGAYVHTITTGGATRSLGIVSESTSDGTADLTRPASNAVLGVAKYSGAQNTTAQIVGVVGKAEPGSGITAIGVAGQATDANGLVNTGVLGIARNGGTLGGGGNVGVIGAANATDAELVTLAGTFPTAGVVAYNTSTTGAALLAMAPTTGTGIEVSGGDISATSAPSGGISTRFSDTYVIPVGGLTVTVPNALVTPSSTVIVTFEDNAGSTPRSYTVETDATGSFDVTFDTAVAADDEIHYIIINH